MGSLVRASALLKAEFCDLKEIDAGIIQNVGLFLHL